MNVGPWANDLFSQYLHPGLVNEGRYHACLVHQGQPLHSSSSPLPTHRLRFSRHCICSLEHPVGAAVMGPLPDLFLWVPHPHSYRSFHASLARKTLLTFSREKDPGPPPSPPALQLPSPGNSPSLLPPSLFLGQPSLLGVWAEPRQPVPASCPLFLPSAPHPAGPRSHSPGALGTPQATKPKDSAAPPGFPARPSSLLQSYGFPATSLPARRLGPPSWIPHLGSRLAS